MSAAGPRASPSARGRRLTAHQEEIWGLVKAKEVGGEGLTAEVAGKRLGISVNVVRKALVVIRKKLGLDVLVEREGRLVENREPDKAAVLIDAETDPDVARMERLRRTAKAEGVPALLTAALLKRWKTRFPNTDRAMRDLKTGEILELVNQRIDLTLGYMDHYAAANASYRDLGLVAAALIERRQLLRGEPTAIISSDDRKKLHELLPRVIAEMQRRGLAVPVEREVGGGVVEPVVVEPVAVVPAVVAAEPVAEHEREEI